MELFSERFRHHVRRRFHQQALGRLKAGKLLLVAHVLPFFPEFRFAADAVRGGKYGRLLGGHFTRVISRPDWSSDIGDASKTGGPAVLLRMLGSSIETQAQVELRQFLKPVEKYLPKKLVPPPMLELSGQTVGRISLGWVE